MGILILRYMVMSENQRDPQYKLRWPEDLRQKVAQSAKEHNRSMNADIVARLEESFKHDAGSVTDYEKTVQKMLFNVMANLHKEGVQIEVIDEAMDKAINDIDCENEKKPT